MATQVFSDVELDRLRGFPGIGREELVRFFTLTPADETFVRTHRGPLNRMGVAVQLCTLPWLGFVPDDVSSAPAEAVARVAGHLRVPGETLCSYGPGSRPAPTTWWRWRSSWVGARRARPS